MRFPSLRLRIRTLMILVALMALGLALIAPAIRPRPKQPLWIFFIDGKRVLATPEEEVRLKAQYFADKAKTSPAVRYLAEKANPGRGAQ